jgi:hypothetical protein
MSGARFYARIGCSLSAIKSHAYPRSRSRATPTDPGTGSDRALSIAKRQPRRLASSSSTVCSNYRSLGGSGLEGIALSEVTVERPWRKDYDAGESNGPMEWPKKFDRTHWGLLGAYESHERVGRAVIATGRQRSTCLRDATTSRSCGTYVSLLQHEDAVSAPLHFATRIGRTEFDDEARHPPRRDAPFHHADLPALDDRIATLPGAAVRGLLLFVQGGRQRCACALDATGHIEIGRRLLSLGN